MKILWVWRYVFTTILNLKRNSRSCLWQIVASFWRGDKLPMASKAVCPSSKRHGYGDDSRQSRGSSERRYDRCIEALVTSHWVTGWSASSHRHRPDRFDRANILPQAALGKILGVCIEASVVFRGSVTSGDMWFLIVRSSSLMWIFLLNKSRISPAVSLVFQIVAVWNQVFKSFPVFHL